MTQFLQELRRNSSYPTFRSFVGFATGLGYLVAAGFALAGSLTGQGGPIALGLGIAFVIGVVVNVVREASLMLADIADAALTLASNQSREIAARDAQRSNYVSNEDLAALARGSSKG
jgi:hypothetical protein